MNAWQLFNPLPVVMISTMDNSGFTRCSPFSWVLPLNKKSTFGVMMRTTSHTLQNLRQNPYFTMSWMRATPEVAQTVLTATKGPNSIDLIQRDFEFKTPADAIAVADCKMNRFVLDLAGVEPRTHHLVICDVLRWEFLEEGLPLLHAGFKTFVTPQKFEVEGY